MRKESHRLMRGKKCCTGPRIVRIECPVKNLVSQQRYDVYAWGFLSNAMRVARA